MAKVKLERRGRIVIPIAERERFGLKAGSELDLVVERGLLVLKPIFFVEPLRVDDSRHKWGKEAFLDAGKATFGE